MTPTGFLWLSVPQLLELEVAQRKKRVLELLDAIDGRNWFYSRTLAKGGSRKINLAGYARLLEHCVSRRTESVETFDIAFRRTSQDFRLAARGESPASHRGRRSAPMTRRDDREYREYLREEQRSQRGCIAGRMQLDFHHGLLARTSR